MLHNQFSYLPAGEEAGTGAAEAALRRGRHRHHSGRRRIVFHPILPNTMAPIRVKISMDIEFAIMSAADLSGIEISPQPRTSE
ncbi:MAG: hypothetical protein M3Q71_00315 [Chloroflexota bacterium]|nr:hypothetical protein [Chloroflexota bacterium]